MAATSRQTTSVPREAPDIIDILQSPFLMEPLFDKAQAIKEKPAKASRAADEALNLFFKGMDVDELEDYFGFGHLEISKRDVLPGSGGPSLSPKHVKQFPSPSVDPARKKMVMFTVPAYTRMLSGPVGMTNYLYLLVTEED